MICVASPSVHTHIDSTLCLSGWLAYWYRITAKAHGWIGSAPNSIVCLSASDMAAGAGCSRCSEDMWSERHADADSEIAAETADGGTGNDLEDEEEDASEVDAGRVNAAAASVSSRTAVCEYWSASRAL